MDDLLERLHATAPSYAEGMSNHGPMVVEALETAGLSAFAPDFVTGAFRLLQPLPLPSGTALMLGDRQEPEWIAHYHQRIVRGSVEAVVRAALPELLPGVMAGATHGIIRLAHAVRGWKRRPSEVRAMEVAHALGYWAAWYQDLPGQVGTAPQADLHTAMATLPGLEPSERSDAGLIMDRVKALAAVPRFAEAIAKVDLRDVATETFLSEMVAIAARLMLTCFGSGFAQLHAITATAAARVLLPYVDPREELALRKAVFHAVAALHAAHGGSRVWLEWTAPAVLPELASLPLAAAHSGGDHAIKLAVTVALEYPLRPDPALLCAAQAEIDRVRGLSPG